MVCHVTRAHATLWRAWLSCNSLADRRPGAAEVGGRSCDNLFSNFWQRRRSALCWRFQARRHSQRPSPSATRNTRPVRPPSGRRTRPRRTSSPLAEPSGAIRFTTCITDARTVITISASSHNLAPVTPPRSFRTDCAFCRRPALAFRHPSSTSHPPRPCPRRRTRVRCARRRVQPRAGNARPRRDEARGGSWRAAAGAEKKRGAAPRRRAAPPRACACHSSQSGLPEISE